MLAVKEMKPSVWFPAHWKDSVDGEHFNSSHRRLWRDKYWTHSLSVSAVGERGMRQKPTVLPSFHVIASRGSESGNQR